MRKCWFIWPDLSSITSLQIAACLFCRLVILRTATMFAFRIGIEKVEFVVKPYGLFAIPGLSALFYGREKYLALA